jgi:alkanesulfonate monooxygenase SsuD/methylene tetrahydromethanopterin reductase-like flavin-dependent oxidoreductase (luciferase family)
MLPGMQARGIALFAGTPADIVSEAARSAEARGYSSFWLNHPGQTDAISRLAVASSATEGIGLGIGVVPLQIRGAASVVDGVRANGLPADRLLLGVGTSGKGAYALARDGVELLRDELGCRVVMAALSEGACRLAGEIADGVLFNWLTPEHARRSAAWVGDGAAAAKRSRPRLYAYVRVALGPGARAVIEQEGTRYARVPSYGAHFERMGVAPVETAIAAAGSAEVGRALAVWEGVVDEVVLRLLPSADSLEAHLELVRAGAPG